jgi:hypothetical protein
MRTLDGPLDLERFVDALARLQPPDRPPRRPRRSLDAGVQVLVDLSTDMLPFRQDLVELLDRLRRVVGADRVTVRRFAGRPWSECGPGRRDTWGAYDPPSTRQPVLVVSNLGLSAAEADPFEAAGEEEWPRLLDELERRGCPVVLLVPNAVDRVPAPLRRRAAVIGWDRTTSAASARRAVGR